MISSQNNVWLRSISLCETVVVWNMGRTNALKCLWFHRAVVNTETVLKTQVHWTHPVTLVTHISFVHWLREVRRLKLSTLKTVLKKTIPHPEKTGRITQPFHKLMWQKKKNTEPRCSVNLIKITNVQCLEWVIQFMMQKLYRRQMVNTWDDLSRYSKCAWLLPLLALWGITHKTRENNPWMLPPTPVTPFDQATCLFPSLLAWLL